MPRKSKKSSKKSKKVEQYNKKDLLKTGLSRKGMKKISSKSELELETENSDCGPFISIPLSYYNLLIANQKKTGKIAEKMSKLYVDKMSAQKMEKLSKNKLN